MLSAATNKPMNTFRRCATCPGDGACSAPASLYFRALHDVLLL